MPKCPNFESNRHEWLSATQVFEDCCEIPLFDGWNKHGAELQVCGADGLMCLFGVSPIIRDWVSQSLIIVLPRITAQNVPFCCWYGSSVTRDEFCFVFMPVCDFPPNSETPSSACLSSLWLEIGSYRNGQHKKEREQNVDSRHPQAPPLLPVTFWSISSAQNNNFWSLFVCLWRFQVFLYLHKQINPESLVCWQLWRMKRPTDHI